MFSKSIVPCDQSKWEIMFEKMAEICASHTALGLCGSVVGHAHFYFFNPRKQIKYLRKIL